MVSLGLSISIIDSINNLFPPSGRTSGLGYAAAQANPSVGASAVLGGSVGEQGYIGAEAHSPGKTVISSKQHSVQPAHPAVPVDNPSPTSAPGAPLPTASSHIQKVKPPKKYSLIRPDVSIKYLYIRGNFSGGI